MKNRIAQLRKELGITQEALADKTGVTRQTIIALEQNRYNPSLGLAYSITKTLKKHSVEEVFKIG
jgi:putative transcriptional regulator